METGVATSNGAPLLLLLVDNEAKANRLIHSFQPNLYRFQTILIEQAPSQLAEVETPDLAILWFPYSSPELLPEFENLVRAVQALDQQAPLPVLLIIDQYGAHWVEPGFRLGITDILTRPIHPLVLRQRVRLLLQAQQTEQAVLRLQESEMALWEERQNLFHVLDMLPVYVYLQKRDFSIYFANRTFINLFGEPGDRKCYQILEGRDSPCENCPAVGVTQSHHPVEWEWISGKGRIYKVYDNLFEQNDGESMVLVIGVDITDLEQSKVALQKEKERFRTVADFTYDWEYWMDKQGGLVYNSPACKRVTGRPAQAFIEDPNLLLEIVHPKDRPMVAEHFGREKIQQSPAALDFRILTESGEERWIGHVCQPVEDSQGRPAGRRISNRDITESKLAEETALRSERLATMGRLLASLAHEINNPLQAMCLNIDLAIDFPLADVERQHHLQVVRQETRRLMGIVASILDFSRPCTADAQPVEVGPVLEQALVIAREQLQSANVRAELHLPPDLPRALIAPDPLQQVCLNIIINASEHMQGGGNLVISAQAHDREVEIDFVDSGEGIPSERLERIFEPFYTTKVNGTGLGLAVSQSIVQQYNGSLFAKSVEGEGTTFTVILQAFG